MKNFLLLTLGLGALVGLQGACGDEPSRTDGMTPSPPSQPGTPPSFPAPQPGTAPQPVLLGGQTGSGSAPVRITCEAADAGASRGFVVADVTTDLRGSCAALVEGAYRKLMPELEPVSSQCVAAATLDPNLTAGAPVCQCRFDAPDPESDTQHRTQVTYAIGLERSRTLLGMPAGGCEAAGPYQWQGSPGSNEACAFTSEEFGGCSLGAAATTCESTCATLRAREAELAARVLSRYEPLGDECRSTHDIGDCYGACIGALRVGEQCYRGVVSRFEDVFRNFEEMDCAAPLANGLEPRETDRLAYLPFCTVHSDVSEFGVTASPDAGSDAGESP
jgi:hypothetical protein